MSDIVAVLSILRGSGRGANPNTAKETVMSVQAETQAKARKVVHADIKPENPAERAAHYIDAPNMP